MFKVSRKCPFFGVYMKGVKTWKKACFQTELTSKIMIRKSIGSNYKYGENTEGRVSHFSNFFYFQFCKHVDNVKTGTTLEKLGYPSLGNISNSQYKFEQTI